MRILFSTASLAGDREQPAAIAALLAADLAPIELGPLPGSLAKPVPEIAAAHLAFLPEATARPNLASGDDSLRRKAVLEISEAITRCEWLGIPMYGVEAGWNLAHTLLHDGKAVGSPGSRPHALAQLARSLDRLAEVALDRGLQLCVSNMDPAAEGLLTHPAEIRRLLADVGAPHVQVALDLAAWEAASRQGPQHFAPDEAAHDLAPHLALLRIPAIAARWMLEVAQALPQTPLVLAGTAADAGALRDRARSLEEALHAPA